MLILSGGIYTSTEIDTPDTTYPLSVSSCGHYRLLNQQHFETYRLKGRKDYQLIYIAKGKATFKIQDETYTLPEGYMVLYHPNECQHYQYELVDSPDIYWIHFSGYAADTILTDLDLSPARIFKTDIKSMYTVLFDNIIEELQLKRKHYRTLCNTYLYELLTGISRYTYEIQSQTYSYNDQVRAMVKLFQSQYHQPFSLNEYAQKCNVSSCWLTRIFHQQMGTSPVDYLTEIRIRKAKELLTSSSYNIGEIAVMVGYQNPLYFSRIFKKRNHVTPSEYRQQSNKM